MLTIEKLREYGANVEEGLNRCMNNEAFYLKLVNLFLMKNDFNKLKEAIDNNNLEEGFKAAHALKGVLGNLSLTPLSNIIYEMTELLRNKVQRDYNEFIINYQKEYDKLVALSKN